MKKIIIILLVLLLLAGAVAGVAYYYVLYPNVTIADRPGDQHQGVIFIAPGTTAEQVLDSLEQKGYVRNISTLKKIAEIKHYEGLVKSGRFRLRKRMNNNELINMLRSGSQEPVQVTFNNIRTLEELAESLDQQLAFTREEFLEQVNDPEKIAELGFTFETIPALFIPNTYELYWNVPVESFLQRMKQEYDRFWNPERLKKASAIGLTPQEVVTLASIVEEETSKKEEYPLVAGVYVNRLKKNMKLDADPTLKYAAGDFTLTRVLDVHKKIDSPYNTYLYPGVPPGPIRIASIQVMESVLNYSRHDYLFFCAKSDFSGYHTFSRTLKQHNANAREYHRALNQRRIYK